MAPRAWGFTPEQLAEQPTVYAPGLLAGRTLLVSGGGSGMGRATAFLAARLGANVIICGRDADKLQRASTDAQRLLGKSFECHAMTIRDAERVDRLMDELFERHGQIDALVNSAGGQFPQNAIDFSVKGWLAVVDTNLNGTWYMMQAAARRWRDRKQAGSVVNIDTLVKDGIVTSPKHPLKVLGNGELSVKLTVQAAAFTASAREKIEAAGGTCEEI